MGGSQGTGRGALFQTTCVVPSVEFEGQQHNGVIGIPLVQIQNLLGSSYRMNNISTIMLAYKTLDGHA